MPQLTLQTPPQVPPGGMPRIEDPSAAIYRAARQIKQLEAFGDYSIGLDQLLPTDPNMLSLSLDQDLSESIQYKLSLADNLRVMGYNFAAGLLGGASFGFEALPGLNQVKNLIIDPARDEWIYRAGQLVAPALLDLDGEVPTATRIAAGMGGIVGSIAGSIPTLGAWMRAGRFVTALPKAVGAVRGGESVIAAIGDAMKAQAFVGDLAGMMMFGFATKERGILTAAATTASGTGFPEFRADEAASWSQKAAVDVANRTAAAAMMGLDTLVVGAVILAGYSLFKGASWSKLAMDHMAAQVRGRDVPLEDLVLAKQIAQENIDGIQRAVAIGDPEIAAAVVDAKAAEELMRRSPNAWKILARNKAAEGVVSYQSGMAALAQSVYDLTVKGRGNAAILRGVVDPYRLLEELRPTPTRAPVTLPGAAEPLEATIPVSPMALGRLEVGPQMRGLPTTPKITEALQPISHTPDEIPAEGFFGYWWGEGVHKDLPIMLANRPNVSAADAGRAVEVVALPTKIRTYGSWNELVRTPGKRGRFPDVETAWRTLRARGVDAVKIEHGANEQVQWIILKPEIITSTRPVTSESINLAAQTADDPIRRMLMSTANAPIEVELAQLLPDFIFETPVKRPDGRYDVLFRLRGSPAFTGKQLQQLKKEGFFDGQIVQYGAVLYKFVRRLKGGASDKVEIEHLGTGERVRGVSVNNITDYPAVINPMPLDEALYKDFSRYLSDRMKALYDMRPGTNGLRELARQSESPTRLVRDLAGQDADMLMYSHELPTPLSDEIYALGREAATPIDDFIDKAFVSFPDTVDEWNIIFRDWAKGKGITGTEGELQALKLGFQGRLNRDLHKLMPADEKALWKKLHADLVEAYEALPDTLDILAKKAGYELMSTPDGYMLKRPGSSYYEGVYTTEDALRAALSRPLRYAGAPDLAPQMSWITANLPSGPGFMTPAGMRDDVIGMFTPEKAHRLFLDDEAIPYEPWRTKFRWAQELEENTGIPFFTQYVEPLLKDYTRALNEATPYLRRTEDMYKGLDLKDREAIFEFLGRVESEATMRDLSKVISLAKQNKMSERQIQWLQDHRELTDEFFRLGMERFGFTPVDYIWNYATRMRKITSEASNYEHEQMFPFLPKELDVFWSKYTRSGMLPQRETDPLIIDMKYIRTFFHEANVKQSWERLYNLLETRFSELPTELQDKIRKNLAGRKEPERALPNAVYAPLNEMLQYMRGYPTVNRDALTEATKTFLSVLGVKVNDQAVRELANAGLSLHYGATLAFRARTAVRNTIQDVLNTAHRVGFSALKVGLQRSLEPEWLERALEADAIHISGRGVAFSEELVIKMLHETPLETKGIRGWFFGGLMKTFALEGAPARFWRIAANKGLKGISTTDMQSRVWAFAAQDAWTRPFAERFLAGKIEAEEMLDQGLRYFNQPVKEEFLRIINRDGLEPAMKYVGRFAVNESNYLYNGVAQPAWMQRPVGRLASQYGTWGFWYKDLLSRNWHAAKSPAEKYRMIATMSMAHAAVALAGFKMGVDMWSWMAPSSILTYGGGPIVRAVTDMIAVAEAPYTEKARMFHRLIRNNVIRNAAPGQLMWGDIGDVLESMPYPDRAFAAAFLGRPTTDIESWGLDLEAGRFFEEAPQVIPYLGSP